LGRLVVAATMTFETMTFDMITELIYNMTIHITTYDTCVYVDNSVDFVDYLWFYTEKTTDGSKMVYNSKRTVVDKKTKRYWISQ
jgi:hypothetical protein